MTFKLHERLNADSALITDLDLCQIRLINNASYPWVILVPRQNGIKETIDLSESDQQQLMREIAMVSHAMKNIYNSDKLNVAGIGNMVPQLHMHVIARFQGDDAWPNPIWGQGGEAYTDEAMMITINKIKAAIENV